MKKIILIIMTMILIMSCGGKKGLSEESKKRIEEEISKINDNMSDMELENMMTTAKLNYDVNPEVGVMYFEKLSKYRPEASRYVAEYYYDKKDYANFEKWIKKSAEGGFLPGMYNLAWYYDETERYAEAEKWYLKYLPPLLPLYLQKYKIHKTYDLDVVFLLPKLIGFHHRV